MQKVALQNGAYYAINYQHDGTYKKRLEEMNRMQNQVLCEIRDKLKIQIRFVFQ